ncbi:MAG: HpaII family restriction endonuclease [Patescibacteria group bacterium]|jgi:type II restriction enzyme
MLKGNKGEWSEIYAFLKILEEGKLFAADENLNKLKNKYFDVLEISRNEAKTGLKKYNITEKWGYIKISDDNNQQIEIVDRNILSGKIDKIFEEIKSASSSSFDIPIADDLMTKLYCSQIKAGSQKKADLFLKIYDSASHESLDLGFSIKSMLGSASTLLNASGATNFIFRINNKKVDLNGINKIVGKSKIRDRMEQIIKEGGSIEYSGTDNPIFNRNLRKIDTIFPIIIANALLKYYRGEGANIQDLIKALAIDKTLSHKYDLKNSDYSYKIKIFLSAIALGMTPNKEWDGFATAHGGYIIVKENGEVLCYHLNNRDQFEEYLLNNTRLETPSSTRHEYGVVYEEKGIQYIKLNLQIRFIK